MSIITEFPRVYRTICDWARRHGITVQDEALSAGKAGEFNGLSVTMNRTYSVEERVYYLVHALGSIVLWSLDKCDVQAMFDELRAAKKSKTADVMRFERAMQRYRAFEIGSSELGVSLLAELRCSKVIAPCTNFMRADLEAMTKFHREGISPVWRVFFSHWNEEVATGRIEVGPFERRSIPSFQPVEIENQEILQQQDRDS